MSRRRVVEKGVHAARIPYRLRPIRKVVDGKLQTRWEPGGGTDCSSDVRVGGRGEPPFLLKENPGRDVLNLPGKRRTQQWGSR